MYWDLKYRVFPRVQYKTELGLRKTITEVPLVSQDTLASNGGGRRVFHIVHYHLLGEDEERERLTMKTSLRAGGRAVEVKEKKAVPTNKDFSLAGEQLTIFQIDDLLNDASKCETLNDPLDSMIR